MDRLRDNTAAAAAAALSLWQLASDIAVLVFNNQWIFF
jgi:hypothetical protein